MTLAEMAIAAGITSTVLGTVAGFVVPLNRALDDQRVNAEVQQRTRAAFHRLQRDLRDAGVWSTRPPSGPALVRPAVQPFDFGRIGRARPPAQPDAITIIVPSPQATHVVTTSPLGSVAAAVNVRAAPGCRPSSARRCRLEADSTVMIVDGSARSDFLRITDVVADTVTLASLDGAALPRYPEGAAIVPIQLRTYYFDKSRAQLRYRDGWRTNAPVVDDVAAVSFRHFGYPLRPSRTGSTRVQAPCFSALPREDRGTGLGLVELSLAELGDGPWCGHRPAYDVDVFRIRRVRVAMRLRTLWADRGAVDRSLLVRPGAATRPNPEVSAHIEVTIRNAWSGQ